MHSSSAGGGGTDSTGRVSLASETTKTRLFVFRRRTYICVQHWYVVGFGSTCSFQSLSVQQGDGFKLPPPIPGRPYRSGISKRLLGRAVFASSRSCLPRGKVTQLGAHSTLFFQPPPSPHTHLEITFALRSRHMSKHVSYDWLVDDMRTPQDFILRYELERRCALRVFVLYIKQPRNAWFG